MQYNDPNWGKAAANLAAAFAPPSGQEIAGFARAGLLQTQRNAMDAEAQRLADLYRMATAPDFNQDQFDRMGMAVGNWNPNQSYYAVDTQDATNRRGQDIDASTRRAVQAMANQSAMERAQLAARAQLVGDRYGDLRPGAVRPEMPADVAGMFGLGAFPEMRGAATPEIVQAGIIEELAQNPNMRIDDPRFESRGTLAGLFRPDQTMSSVWAGVEGDLTQERIRQQGALDRDRAGPVLVNQNQTAFLSPEEAALRDLPEVIMGQASVGQNEIVARPDGTMMEGLRSPLTESQQRATERQGLIDSGQLTDDLLLQQILSEYAPVEAIGPEGSPIFMSRGEAVQTQAQPAATGESSAAEDRIARVTENLMATGTVIDPAEARNVAVAIVDGRYRADRDPITREVTIVDMATGMPVYGGTRQTAQAAEPTPPQESQFGEAFADPTHAFGASGFGARVVNQAADSLNLDQPFPETAATQRDFAVLKENLLNDIASAYNRQPPSWLLQEIRELTPSAGSLLEGPATARSKLEALGRQMEGQLQAAEETLARPLSPSERLEAEGQKAGLQQALARIGTALRSFERAQAPDAPAPSGPTPQPPQPPRPPQPGDEEDGFRFRGGDPGDPNNWERVR